MRKTVLCIVIILTSLAVCETGFAHFGMVIPTDSMVMQGESKVLKLQLSFSHPFERLGMELVKPKVFAVAANGKRTDLLGKLNETRVMGHLAWEVEYRISRPGVYVFYMEPYPYWEPAEDCFITHFTKTVVTAFGDDEDWDQEIGLETEIVPLSKPFGLYVGNVFQGVVMLNGNPVPYSQIEVEYYNEDGKSDAPNEYMVTQTIKADRNGVFTYAAPKSGWWGFAALNTSAKKMKHAGESKDIEMGAVIWVKFHDWKTK